MPSVKIYNISNAAFDRQIDYELGDERLSGILGKYEKQIGQFQESQGGNRWNVSFGEERFLDLNLALISCLGYGDSMVVSNHRTNLVIDNKDESEIQVTAKTLSGKLIVIEAKLSDSVECVKRKIHDRDGIPPDQQRLIWKGCQLEDVDNLMDYGISDKCVTIHLILRLRGGGGFSFANVSEEGS